MSVDPHDDAIDDIIATCNGDMRGALRALLLVNEYLEKELRLLQLAVAQGGRVGRPDSAFHSNA